MMAVGPTGLGPRYLRTETPLLTILEAAQQLRVSRWQIYELLNQGRLPSVYINRRRLIPRAELNAFVQRLREQGERS